VAVILLRIRSVMQRLSYCPLRQLSFDNLRTSNSKGLCLIKELLKARRKTSQSLMPRTFKMMYPPGRSFRSIICWIVFLARLDLPMPGSPRSVSSLLDFGDKIFEISLNISFWRPTKAGYSIEPIYKVGSF
jgi:hypothetical protein